MMHDNSNINDRIIPLSDPDQIELDKHAIIEASAGTGKTYAIEQLVVRLLVGSSAVNPPILPLTIDQILVVTFTEKATGEMKDRIRNAIEAKLTSAAIPDDQQFYLHEALENFDHAQISTLHGFCHRTLREHAFENGRQFEYDVVDGQDIYHKLLLRQMREDWPKRYGRNLKIYLALADFPHLIQSESQWINTTIRLAQDWREHAGDRLHPEPDANFAPADVVLKLEQHITELATLVGAFQFNSIEDHPLYKAYSALNFNAGSRKSCLTKIIRPLLERLCDFGKETNDIPNPGIIIAMFKFIQDSKGYQKFAKSGFTCLMPEKWNKTGSNLDQECPHLQSVIDRLEQIRELAASFAPHFMSHSVKQLQTDVRFYKEQRGLLTYSDMISMVAEALSQDANNKITSPLLSALRNRYKIALVDEFQDTDILQWSILKKVFINTDDGSRHRLIVVGDPKQAIYGFRGADLNAYYMALNQLRTLGETKTKSYSLDTNWRSIPQLVDGFNSLFEQNHWFQSNNIRYRRASVPPPELRRNRLYRDTTGCPVLITHDLDAETLAKTAQERWFKFIAAEIDRLLNSPTDMLVFGDNNSSPRSLRADDICILCQNKTEAGRMEKALNNGHIPYSFYKKPGLYESDEALQLFYLLRAIALPNDMAAFRKLLMTRFFAIPVSDIRDYENLPPDHCIKRLFSKWVNHAENRDWAMMFHSILDHTGVLLRREDDPNFERRLTNIEQIIQELHHHALTENMDIIDMVALLGNRYHKHVPVAEEDNLHRRDTEHAKVQMTTIHKSKGLEFPVVFLAGGITAPPNTTQPYYKIHNGKHSVYDLTSESKSQWQDEQHEEMQRLYYVALTRAMYKLYIPFFRNLSSSGSVAKILHPAIAAATGHLPTTPVMTDLIDQSHSEFAQSKPTAIQLDPIIQLPHKNFHLRDRNRSLNIDSYSGLKSRWLTNEPDQVEEISNHFGNDQEEEPAADETSPTPSEREADDHEAGAPMQHAGLPPGRFTGNLLHHVFESIDFQIAGSATSPNELLDADEAKVINKVMQHYQMSPENTDQLDVNYRLEIVNIVWAALNIELPDGIKLRDIPAHDRHHELEFFFPYPQINQIHISVRNRYDGFIKGYIDLIFRWQNEYYILDWKSDRLDDYAPDQLEKHMRNNHYDLQYKLYAIAVHRWLQRDNKSCNLAGVFYLFLRGLKPETHNGIYSVMFQDGIPPVQDYENELNELVQANPESLDKLGVTPSGNAPCTAKG